MSATQEVLAVLTRVFAERLRRSPKGFVAWSADLAHDLNLTQPEIEHAGRYRRRITVSGMRVKYSRGLFEVLPLSPFTIRIRQ